MELKLELARINEQLAICSNRTFMELKLELARINEQLAIVLIVPLWN